MNSIYQEIGSEEIKTGSRTKNWNEAKWIEFIEELIKRDRAEQLIIPRVTQQSEQFFALLRYTMPDQFTDVALKNIVKGFIEQSK